MISASKDTRIGKRKISLTETALPRLSKNEKAELADYLTSQAFSELNLHNIKSSSPDGLRGALRNFSNETVQLYRALLKLQRVSFAEFVFCIDLAVENKHWDRTAGGNESPDLAAIQNEMRAIEAREGLEENQYWSLTDCPDDYAKANDRYMEQIEKEIEGLFREFGCDDLAQLRAEDRKKYDELRERGRRNMFHPKELRNALSELINAYDMEFVSAADNKNFLSATIVIATALEARILLKVLRHPILTKRHYDELKGKRRFFGKEPLYWSFDDLVAIAVKAGWLRDIQVGPISFSIEQMLSGIKSTRNLVHSGRHLRERPHILVEEGDYKQGLAAYRAARLSLERTNR